MSVLAVDVGGTKLAVALVDESGNMTARCAAPTPRTDDAERIWSALHALVDQALARADERGDAERGEVVADACGVGCGGPMTAGGELVSPLNIPAWREFPLAERLAAATGLVTCVDNDAKALALGEGWCGAARGERNFIAIVVSTGVGGGIVLDGRLLDGALGNAGHIGHVIVEPGGEHCACGSRGCLEALASGRSIERITGRPAAVADVGVRARTGRLVGRAVADVANLLDLRLAVVGGSVALGFGEVFFAPAQAELDAGARLDFSRGARVVPVGLADRGPLIGAAAVALRAQGRLPGIG